MRPIASTLKALADETRLQILALLLKHGELCVCDFEEVLGITQSKSSRHLRYLLNAGLLEDRREAVWVHYRVARKLGPEQKAILKTLAGLLTAERNTELFAKFDRWHARKCKSGEKTCCDI